MLNHTAFILLAGNPHAHDAEMRRRVDAGENICNVQVDQAGRGRLSAHLVLSIHGWTVRYASGLQNFGILHKSGSFDPSDAMYWGCTWVSTDPDNRELYVAKSDVDRAERDGHDCSCLREWEGVLVPADGTS